MTALELNAEIYRAMGRTADEIVDDIRSARTSNNIDIEL